MMNDKCMGNLSMELPRLLKESLERVRREGTVCGGGTFMGLYDGRTYLGRSLGFVSNLGKEKKDIKYYEWSDMTRCPLSFNTVDDFMKFLNSCGVKVYPHDVIRMESMQSIYGICRFGCNELIFASTKDNLSAALRDELPY